MPTDPPAQAARPAGAAPAGPRLGARALGFYRRAQAALRVGDVAGAILNLRMAVAAEPTSAYLRQALADAQAHLTLNRAAVRSSPELGGSDQTGSP